MRMKSFSGCNLQQDSQRGPVPSTMSNHSAHGGSFAVASCMCGSASVRAAAIAAAACTLHLSARRLGCCWGRLFTPALLLLLPAY